MLSARPVQLSSVSYAYAARSTPVLEQVDANFAAASATCLWGPSGSGKSTLLSVVGAVVRPTQGSVEHFGVDVWSGRHRRRVHLKARDGTSWVTQTANVIPGMAALDNVALGAIAKGAAIPDAYARAQYWLTALGLDGLESVAARKLSGGQSQRVAVARALTAATPIILADEPTGQLDHGSTRVVIDALRRCAMAGRTVIIASHDPLVAEACDRRLLVADGKVTEG